MRNVYFDRYAHARARARTHTPTHTEAHTYYLTISMFSVLCSGFCLVYSYVRFDVMQVQMGT